MPIRFDILTTFPEMFGTQSPAALGLSIPGRAATAGNIEVVPTNIRDFADPPHNKTDDRPFGGGPGMVMLPEPLCRAVEHAEAQDPRPATRILLTPQGERLTQPIVEDLAAADRLLLICGHYEGIDERAIDHLSPRELSIGDFVLSGGEMAALVLIDAVARLQAGVLGDAQSPVQDSFGVVPTTNPNGEPVPERTLRKWLAELGVEVGDDLPRLLDCPHYTRPRSWRGVDIPEALVSGDHERVMRWRLERMVERTRARAPWLLSD